MSLPKKFRFSKNPALQAEAERRSILMFGEDWRNVCSKSEDVSHCPAIIVRAQMISFSENALWTWYNDELEDLLDGSPAYVEYHPDGVLHRTSHYCDSYPVDPSDGGPARIEYSECGEIIGGASSEKGGLTVEETSRLVAIAEKANQIRRVEALLAKADQSVIPSVMALKS